LTPVQEDAAGPVASVDADGVVFEVAVPHSETDYIQGNLLRTGEPYEHDLLRALAAHVSEGDLVVDVGANVGNHTLYLAVVAGARVLAFEPNPELTAALARSVRLNGLEERVEVRQRAVADTAGRSSFTHLDAGNLGAQRIAAPGQDGDFAVVRLDDEETGAPVRVLKIDVEGFELGVLRGAEQLILRDRPWISVECQDAAGFEAVNAWLTDHGYAYQATFNATPTHLFGPGTEVSAASGATAAVLETYRLRDALASERAAHDEASLRYRELGQRRAADQAAADRVERERGNWEMAYQRVRGEAIQAALVNERLDGQLERTRARVSRQARRIDTEFRHNKKLKRELKDVQAELRKVRSSARYRLGSALAGSVRSPRRLLRLPLDLARLVGGRLRRRRRRAGSQPVAVPAVVTPRTAKPVSCLPVTRLSQVRALSPEDLTRRAALAAASSAALRARRAPGTTPRVAAIVDDFTRQSLRMECDFQDLHPDAWRDEMESFRPDLLFVESAWRGDQGSWHNTISRVPEELVEILEWCREHAVPTVFWNKEDPVHFETFLRVAAEFDHVLTTDVDRVSQYRGLLGHDRVGFMPFAAQPRLQTPVETHERKQALAFAGSYYTRYVERMRDLRAIVSGAAAVMPVEIFDRNLGTTLPDYAFPEEYQQYIVGTLQPSEIETAYKGYRFALNLNSVKGSQSMFARRAFELLASNTLTISNYARGLKVLLGDLVPMSDSQKMTRAVLEELTADVARADRLAAAGLRKVLDQHTYAERLRYIMSVAASLPFEQQERAVVALGLVADVEAAHRLLDTVRRQEGVHVDTRAVTQDAQAAALLAEHGVTVLGPEEAASTALRDVTLGAAAVVAVLDPRDWYGPHYLHDLANATQYSDAGVIGKSEHFAAQGDGSVSLSGQGGAYRAAADLPLRRAALAPAASAALTVAELVAPGAHAPEGLVQISIHRFDYCADGAGQTFDVETVTSELDVDQGWDLSEIYRSVEAQTARASVDDDCPVLPLEALATTRADIYDAPLAAALTQDRYRITSRLASHERRGLRQSKSFDTRELWPDGVARFGFAATGDLRLSLVLRFYGESGEMLGTVTRGAGTEHVHPLPEGTVRVRASFKTTGPGTGFVHRVFLGRWDFESTVQLPSSDVLLVTDSYPQYDDLYRNGFVHARVRRYRAAGRGLDVFRFRRNVPAARHEFEGVEVATGGADALRAVLETGAYRTVAVHFLTRAMWDVLEEFQDRLDVVVWVHGAEIQPWWRRRFNFETEAALEDAKAVSEERQAFWRSLLDGASSRLHLVFVSQHFADEVMEDLERVIPQGSYSVIHNPIDTDIFAYEPKPVEQRTRVLSIRPYASRIYANDLAVAAVLDLSERDWFDELEFRFVGDGPLFEETVQPLRGFDNVVIERGYLSHHEIADLYREHGVALIPTRSDTHGVSRDEAMSAGLVPVTSGVAAVPEFVSEREGVLAPFEDHVALAEGIAMLHDDPAAFSRMSQAAAARVRAQSAADVIIPQEIALLWHGR